MWCLIMSEGTKVSFVNFTMPLITDCTVVVCRHERTLWDFLTCILHKCNNVGCTTDETIKLNHHCSTLLPAFMNAPQCKGISNLLQEGVQTDLLFNKRMPRSTNWQIDGPSDKFEQLHCYWKMWRAAFESNHIQNGFSIQNIMHVSYNFSALRIVGT